MSIKNNEFGIADMQDKILDILKYFISVCEQNDLHYWLAAGTCLGALRHQGFIPWDDDLDVFIPREDYEKLWSLLGGKADSHYLLCRTTREKNYHHRVMQIVDLETTFINTRCRNEDIEHGVYMDIMPLDGCPNGKFQRLKQAVHAVLFSVFNIQCKAEFNGGRMTPIINTVTSVLLGLVKSPEARYRIWKSAEKKMAAYAWNDGTHIRNTAGSFHALRHPFLREWFGERKVPFEDIECVIPSGAEEYCTIMYGDYMKLPPADKQAVKHHTEFIDLKNPYTKYKGIYYCKD